MTGQEFKTLKKFFKNINNVKQASPEDIQSDILHYLFEVERLQSEKVAYRNEWKILKQELDLKESEYQSAINKLNQTTQVALERERRINNLLEVIQQKNEEISKLKIIQERLIEQLKKADEYSDKLEWKLFWEAKDEILEEVSKRKGKNK